MDRMLIERLLGVFSAVVGVLFGYFGITNRETAEIILAVLFIIIGVALIGRKKKIVGFAMIAAGIVAAGDGLIKKRHLKILGGIVLSIGGAATLISDKIEERKRKKAKEQFKQDIINTVTLKPRPEPQPTGVKGFVESVTDDAIETVKRGYTVVKTQSDKMFDARSRQVDKIDAKIDKKVNELDRKWRIYSSRYKEG